MTPAQCRAGRALLELTQPLLASAASVSLSTVVDFEKQRRQVSKRSVAAIRSALEASGVVFLDENGNGPGVALKKGGT